MRLGFSCSMPRCAGVSTRPAPLGQIRCGLIPTRRRTALRDYASGASVSFLIQRRHVVVFSVQMRKIFPFGVPRGVLAIHSAPSMLSPICKNPGRALQVSGERGSVPFQPAPNRNILHICARFPTRWSQQAWGDGARTCECALERLLVGCNVKKTPSLFNIAAPC